MRVCIGEGIISCQKMKKLGSSHEKGKRNIVLILLFSSSFAVMLHKQSLKAHKLPKTFPEWRCALGTPGSKERVWTCCPMGWKPFRANCYYLSSDSMSGDESEKNCTGMGSHLVVINTQAEQDFLLSWTKVIFSSSRTYFIGLSAQEVEAQWRWVDQTPYNETAIPSGAERGSGGPLWVQSGSGESGGVGVLVVACDMHHVDVTLPADCVVHHEAARELGVVEGDVAATQDYIHMTAQEETSQWCSRNLPLCNQTPAYAP
ncbi:C-type lectin domain family 4 member E [Alligator mississippiensis]|uniref:C-type lectin domain family 4 member E n=1 Tax=Alligator mississippiensis TaxID=8496 RepID=UPI002877ECC3|nr:C-type lectin domain family 4 member E [Alligator mississippiensis]